MTKVWLAVYVLCAIATVCGASVSSITTSVGSIGTGDQCRFYDRYPTFCHNVTGCAFCCETQRCFSSSDASQCDEAAILPRENKTCDDLCKQRIGMPSGRSSIIMQCEMCIGASFCLFCPYDKGCYSRDTIQCGFSMWGECDKSYNSGTGDDEDREMLPYAIWGCLAIGILCALIPLGRWCYVKIQSRRTQRREAAMRRTIRAQQREREAQAAQPTAAAATTAAADRTVTVNGDHEERQPLLAAAAADEEEAQEEDADTKKKKAEEASALESGHNTSISTFDDADACQLCLDRPASVIYLPCYHQFCCEECSDKLRPAYRRHEGHGVSCPFCRQRIRAMISTRPLHPVIKAALQKRE